MDKYYKLERCYIFLLIAIFENALPDDSKYKENLDLIIYDFLKHQKLDFPTSHFLLHVIKLFKLAERKQNHEEVAF